jgi:hypothetical protein
MAESILSQATQRAPRPLYYLRRAHIYRAASARISDDDASLLQKSFAIMYLAILEHTQRQHDLEVMHIQALDEFILSSGGADIFRHQSENDAILLCCARFYASQFVRAEVRMSTKGHFRIVVSRFMHSLRQIEQWILRLRSLNPLDAAKRGGNCLNLKPLADYFNCLERAAFPVGHNAVSWPKASGAHFCAFSLIITLMDNAQTAEDAHLFLRSVQECMQRSSDRARDSEEELGGLHPFAGGHIIHHVRTEVYPDIGNLREIKIFQAVVDAQKIFALLDQEGRKDLVAYLISCIFDQTMDRDGRTSTRFRLGSFYGQRSLKLELESAWDAQTESLAMKSSGAGMTAQSSLKPRNTRFSPTV